MFPLELVAKLIDNATAHLAEADPAELTATRAKLFAVLDSPTQATWDAAHSILVAPCVTLWQATVHHAGYNVIARPVGTAWPSLPTAEQLHDALESLRALPV